MAFGGHSVRSTAAKTRQFRSKGYFMRKLLLLALCLVVFGCDSTPSPDGMPKLSSCTVTVQSDGQPFENAVVEFHHPDPTFRWTPSATTNTAGKAVMVTHGQYFGVVDGDYVITVNKTERAAFDPEKPPKEVKVYTFVDPKFCDPKTSPLKIGVAGKTVQTVDVGKAVWEVLRTESPM